MRFPAHPIWLARQHFYRQWAKALRSGWYAQGARSLCFDDQFCCLGIACEILGIPKAHEGRSVFYDGQGTMPSGRALDLMGISQDEARDLARLNDNKTFPDIAAVIEGRWIRGLS